MGKTSKSGEKKGKESLRATCSSCRHAVPPSKTGPLHTLCGFCLVGGDKNHFSSVRRKLSGCEACISLAKSTYRDYRLQAEHFRLQNEWLTVAAVKEFNRVSDSSSQEDSEIVIECMASEHASDDFSSPPRTENQGDLSLRTVPDSYSPTQAPAAETIEQVEAVLPRLSYL
jgi:hypothetical protein